MIILDRKHTAFYIKTVLLHESRNHTVFYMNPHMKISIFIPEISGNYSALNKNVMKNLNSSSADIFLTLERRGRVHQASRSREKSLRVVVGRSAPWPRQ